MPTGPSRISRTIRLDLILGDNLLFDELASIIRVVEKIIIRQDPQCLASLEQARELIAAASQRLVEQTVEQAEPVMFAGVSKSSTFPTMAEMERAMIVSAYNRSNHKSIEAAKLLGMGKTTF